ncbi:MAG: hypothetical protein IAI48_12345, partial [Candidatus Eremiobacteraeota bacterium]|nr:hypothetical protein [Candidatus Eremiobacteraeota bacterium]
MIERFERVAPLRVPAVLPWAKKPAPARPAGSVVAMPRGEIAGDVRLLERSDRERRATYEVLVANETGRPLAAFADAVNAGRGKSRMTWNAMVVPPFSAIAVEIEIALPRRGRPPRIVAEVHAEDAQLTLDSAPQLSRFSAGTVRRAAALAATFVLAAGGVVGLLGARPKVAAMAAPPRVVAGSEVSVAYALSNASGGEYTVERPDGLQVRRGFIPAGSGAFTIAMPAGAQAGGYDLHVTARGRFGSDERSMHLAAYVPPPAASGQPDGVKIASVGLASETVVAGTPIIVNYRTAARAGTVRLIDEYGTVRAEALLSRSGTSMLAAPLVDADQDLRVVVTAERGATRDEAQTPVRVLRSMPPGAGGLANGNVAAPQVPALAPVTGDDAQTMPLPADVALSAGAPQTAPVPIANGVRKATAVPNGPPIDVKRAQSATQPILVHVLRYEPKMRVSVLGNSGEELEGANVAPGDSVVSLSSPKDLGTKHPSIVATYEHGSEQET